MSEIMTSLSKWFSKRHQWLQEAVMRLSQRELTDNDITELAIQCQKEADGTLPPTAYPFPNSVVSQSAVDPLRLCSISDVEGVNALAPTKPLEFGKGNITVVYGNNGSGKSGYVRLLKHICGARKPGILHRNVYDPDPAAQKACISFEQGSKQKIYEWPVQGICDDLSGVDIFDASFGKVFASSGDEVNYEPPELLFFSSLIDVCEKVAETLKTEANKHQSKKPNMPTDKQSTPEGAWYVAISANTTPQDIDNHCAFNSTHESEMQALQKRLDEKAPAEEAKRLKRQKQYADTLVQDVQKHLEQLSDKNCQKIIIAKKESIDKKTAADTAAKTVFSGGKLEGVGSDVWKCLWQAARHYSVEVAYKKAEYPNVSEGSLCVLCHQTLGQEAKDRLISFESFVQDKMQKAAIEAASKYKDASQTVEDLPAHDPLKARIAAAGITHTQEETPSQIVEFFTQLQARKDKILGINPEEAILPPLLLPQWVEVVKAHSKKIGEAAAQYEDDAKNDNRDETKKNLNSLQVRKWLSENLAAINKEVTRLAILSQIEKAKQLAGTTVLSRKKRELTEVLITKAFVERFNTELNALGASQIRVEFVKPEGAKSRVLHKLRLRGVVQIQGTTQGGLIDVLSEGESRIVSIAAFLADATAKKSHTPLIFDDPISSLDQNYEDAVVRRLIELSKNRQVIVFTHRLPLLATVRLFAERTSINLDVVSIRSVEWGTGEPAPIPLSQRAIGAALNALMERHLAAKKAHEKRKFDVAETILKAICSDFRIIVEHSIENDLLCGVVKRLQRPVHTLKIKKLAKLEIEDCNFLYLLMTKYSAFEHSQSEESPGNSLMLDDLLKDMNALKNWREEYRNRPVPSAAG